MGVVDHDLLTTTAAGEIDIPEVRHLPETENSDEAETTIVLHARHLLGVIGGADRLITMMVDVEAVLDRRTIVMAVNATVVVRRMTNYPCRGDPRRTFLMFRSSCWMILIGKQCCIRCETSCLTCIRNFIAYIENSFKDRSLRCDVLLLSPRLSEAAVIRRQVLEGVLAVIRLTRENQATGKLSLQLFDRRDGAEEVKFERKSSGGSGHTRRSAICRRAHANNL
jgi:hypothetical protein